MRSPTRSDRLFSLVPGSVRHFSLLWSVCPFGGSRAPLRRTSQARRGSPAKGGMRRLFWAALSEKALQKRGSPLSCESKKREKPPPWRTVPFGPGRRRGGIAAEESNLCGRDGSERKQPMAIRFACRASGEQRLHQDNLSFFAPLGRLPRQGRGAGALGQAFCCEAIKNGRSKAEAIFSAMWPVLWPRP